MYHKNQICFLPGPCIPLLWLGVYLIQLQPGSVLLHARVLHVRPHHPGLCRWDILEWVYTSLYAGDNTAGPDRCGGDY